MFRFPRRIESSRHYVSRGRVACPRHPEGDVDVDSCYGCSFLTDADFDGPGPWVRCEPRANPALFGPAARIDAL